MQRFILGSAMALACTAGLAAAQSATIKQETKVDVKDGKDVTVTGCVARAANGTALTLTDVEGKDVDSRVYILVGEDDSLDEHVGHMVEIRGKAADAGDEGKVEVKTKTKIEREDADDKETESKTEIEGDLAGVPYLGVKSVKMVRSSCS